jgi:UDP-glucose 4-epimerase
MPTSEGKPPRPRSPCAVSNLAGELSCSVFSELYGLETVSLHVNAYGPREHPNSAYVAVMPLLMNALRRGGRATIHGDGHQSRDFTYVEEVVAGNLAAASVPAEVCSERVYNIAGRSPRSIVQLLDILSKILDVEPGPLYVDPRPVDVRHSRADMTAAARDLGLRPPTSFEEGLRRTVTWFASLDGLGSPPVVHGS